MIRVKWVRDAHSPWARAGEPDFWCEKQDKTKQYYGSFPESTG